MRGQQGGTGGLGLRREKRFWQGQNGSTSKPILFEASTKEPAVRFAMAVDRQDFLASPVLANAGA